MIFRDHLIRLGCRELRLFAEPGAACSVDARAAGIRDALLLRSVPLPRELRIEGDPTDPQFIRKSVCGRGIDALTIHQTSRDIATVAFRALEARIHDAALPTCTMLLDPKLVIRDSCGPYVKSTQESTKRTPRRK